MLIIKYYKFSLLMIIFFLLLCGCNKPISVLLLPVKFDSEIITKKDISKIEKAYFSAVNNLLNDQNFKKKTVENKVTININKKFNHKLIKGKWEIWMESYLQNQKTDFAVWAEIIQPDKSIKFAYCKLTFYKQGAGIRYHHQRGILISIESFTKKQFWEAELNKIFSKLIKVKK